ncbi:unnamed protein product [Effrenium voratum]|uniref:Uncharacterized protein n=1 Tax=Effrenium voratum TaxID=2562239 RepID=A0AA36J640_9DINO|nr:unnamed protein product [Effrenium voratum]
MAKPRRSHEEIEAEQEMELLRQEAMEAEERSRPLQSLPAQTAKLLLEILSESQVFQQNLEDQQLDLCHEVSRDEVQEALFLLKTSSTEREATAILDCFPGDAPHLTIFELCARVGRGDLLRSLQSAAQGKLRDLIFGGRASLQQVFRLLRAGAELSRQNLSSFVNLKAGAWTSQGHGGRFILGLRHSFALGAQS